MPSAATAKILDASLAARPAGRGRACYAAFRRILAGSHVVSLTDQALVSAASFLALIMIGRWGGPSQLGAYAIGGSVLALMIAAQEALVTRPYAIQLHRPPGTPAEHAFGSLLFSFLLSAAGSLGLGAVALAMIGFDAHRDLVAICAVLAAVIPFILLREFARRFAFAHLRTRNALRIDLAAAALNIAALGWLGWTGRLSAVTAFAATGISCAICTVAWLCLARGQFAFRFAKAGATVKQSWAMGKWLLSGQLALQAQGYMTYWLSLVVAGAAVTGVYAACMSIVSFANPLLFGFFNILTPRSVQALRNGGGSGLRRQAAFDALLLLAAMSVFCLVIFVAGEPAMRLLFPAMAYEGIGRILEVLALAALASAVGVPASIALAGADRARAVAAVMVATAVLNVVLVWALITQWGLLGAAYGVLASEIVGSAGRWAVFLALVPGRLRNPSISTTDPTLERRLSA
jgi:O-antigen/teichoic acid export membrane protein